MLNRVELNAFTQKIGVTLVFCTALVFLVNQNPFVPKMNLLPVASQSIYETGEYINHNSHNNSVIATWWDLGYTLQAFARRPTFFDGGLFATPRVYWMAKALATTDENVAANSLHIMACGKDVEVNGQFSAWSNTKPQKISQFNTQLSLNFKDFKKKLRETTILNFDCDSTVDIFFIVHEDMLYKNHFFDYYANWNFRDASIRKRIKGLSESDAVPVLTSEYNLSKENAQVAYSYARVFKEEFVKKHVTKITQCFGKETGKSLIFCGNGFVIDLDSFDARIKGVHPKSLVFIQDKKKKTVRYNDSKADFSVIIYMIGNEYRSFLISDELMQTIPVRMFIGDQLDLFEHVFTSQESPHRIVVYRLKRDQW